MLIRIVLSFFGPRYPQTIAYMLQATEYNIGSYMRWYWRTQDFSTIMQRGDLDKTRRARLLLAGLRVGTLLQITVAVGLIVLGVTGNAKGGLVFGLALFLSYPIVWAHLIVLPLWLARYFIVAPKDAQNIAASKSIFAHYPGVIIAVVGSYGKTSMKELLSTVLNEGKNVAATPANNNVATEHAAFAHQLTGNEDVLIIEYGEGKPGDVARFTQTTHPTHAVITGLAPAHLDAYKTLDAAGKDIFSVADTVPHAHVYVNAEALAVQSFLQPDFQVYSQQGIDGWKVDNVTVSLQGTSFRLQKTKTTLSFQSGLLGKHHIGPLCVAAILGLEFGLSEQQVTAGIAKTMPFEHRMQPYQLSGAWIIDDTYNGNLEGIRAGAALLRDLSAARKWYVTPGLVEQGAETARIHAELGKLVAAAQPDIVVLMQNTVTKYIQAGLTEADYAGEVRIEANPLAFYTNLEQHVATGDLVLMQNDWTDNYA
jgi:UDP-N-acetylmuramyl pentapeptide synthase